MTFLKRIIGLALVLVLSACGGGGGGSSSPTDGTSRLQSISIDLPATVANGKSVDIKVTGKYSDGSTSVLSSSATFKSSDETIATAYGQSFSAKKLGTVTITATYLFDYKATATVQVTAPEPQSLLISGYVDGLNSYSVRDARTLTAQIRYTDYSKVSPKGAVTWSSSMPTVATVNAQGKVTPLATGTTTITAEADGYKATRILSFVQPLNTPLITINCDGNDAISAKVWNDKIANDANNTTEWFKFGPGCVQYPVIILYFHESPTALFYKQLARAERTGDANGFVPATTYVSEFSNLTAGAEIVLGYKNLEGDFSFNLIKTLYALP